MLVKFRYGAQRGDWLPVAWYHFWISCRFLLGRRHRADPRGPRREHRPTGVHRAAGSGWTSRTRRAAIHQRQNVL